MLSQIKILMLVLKPIQDYYNMFKQTIISKMTQACVVLRLMKRLTTITMYLSVLNKHTLLLNNLRNTMNLMILQV